MGFECCHPKKPSAHCRFWSMVLLMVGQNCILPTPNQGILYLSVTSWAHPFPPQRTEHTLSMRRRSINIGISYEGIHHQGISIWRAALCEASVQASVHRVSSDANANYKPSEHGSLLRWLVAGGHCLIYGTVHPFTNQLCRAATRQYLLDQSLLLLYKFSNYRHYHRNHLCQPIPPITNYNHRNWFSIIFPLLASVNSYDSSLSTTINHR